MRFTECGTESTFYARGIEMGDAVATCRGRGPVGGNFVALVLRAAIALLVICCANWRLPCSWAAGPEMETPVCEPYQDLTKEARQRFPNLTECEETILKKVLNADVAQCGPSHSYNHPV